MLHLRKNSRKTSTRKLNLPEIIPRPAAWEVTLLSHSTAFVSERKQKVIYNQNLQYVFLKYHNNDVLRWHIYIQKLQHTWENKKKENSGISTDKITFSVVEIDECIL